MTRGQIWQKFPKLLRFMALFPPPYITDRLKLLQNYLRGYRYKLSQEWPWETKPKKGQFMNFSQGHSGTKVQCESCLFSSGKTPEFTTMGEIHAHFVLALSLVWFAGATPDLNNLRNNYGVADTDLAILTPQLVIGYRHVIHIIARTPPQSRKPIRDVCNLVCNQFREVCNRVCN